MNISANSTEIGDYYDVYSCDENCQRLHEMYERFKPFHFGVRMFFCILGITTNFSFIYVMARVKFIRMNVNYYLLNLSIADFLYLLMAFLLLLTKLGIIPTQIDSNTSCIIYFSIFPIPLFTSILTVTMISVERYLSICRPFSSRLQITKTRTILMAMGTWIGAASYCSIFIVFCNKDLPMEAEVSLVFVPLVILATVTIILYSLVVRVIRRHIKLMAEMQGNDRILIERKQLIKMLVITTVLFFICQFIYVIGRFLFSIAMKSHSPQVYIPLMIFCDITLWFQYLNSIINPILYNIISRKHRLAYKKAFCCCITRPEDFTCVDSQRESTKVTRTGKYELAVEEPHRNGDGKTKRNKERSTITNNGL